jgi:DegV family protein with EDD domain
MIATAATTDSVKVAVVTDTTCDLPAHLVREMGIHVVPVPIHIGQKTYHDTADITRRAFYELMPTLPDLPQTSAPASGVFEQLYAKLLQKADAVGSLHVASTLSGVYHAASVGAAAVDEKRIAVIDSGQLSMGMGWAVLAAAQFSRAGADTEVIQTQIIKTLKQVRVLAIFNTMKYLQKSGRVSWIRANTGALLRIKPMLELREGEIIPRGRIRTWSKAVGWLAEQVRQLGSLRRLALMHTSCLACVQDLQARLSDVLPAEPPLIVDATPVIGAHVGPHALGIAALLRDEE